MGIFSDRYKPKVTHQEWREKVRSALSARGFERREIDYLETLLHGHLFESSKRERGLQTDEIKAILANLKNNRRLHTLSDKQINIVEEELHKRL
jgi:hypothetical protein